MRLASPGASSQISPRVQFARPRGRNKNRARYFSSGHLRARDARRRAPSLRDARPSPPVSSRDLASRPRADDPRSIIARGEALEPGGRRDGRRRRKRQGARRRQKLLDNAKTFDKKSGTFREPKLELVNDKVSREDILRAPSSFRRFMEATRRAKAREERRDKQRRIAQGLEALDDDDDDVDDDDPSSPRRDDTGAAEGKGCGGATTAPSSAGDGG